jgi:hypothetical protein
VIFHDQAWPALVVEIGRVERHIEVAKQRGGQIAGRNGPLLDVATVRLSRANHLAMAQAAAGQAHRHHLRPVVAAVGTALRADHRRAAKFTHRDHEHVV